MKTSTLVVGMTGAGILGGVVGALLFLTFFADSFRPAREAPPPLPAEEPVLTREEADALRRLPRRIEELEGAVKALRRESERPPPPARPSAARPTEGAAGEGSPAELMARNERAAIATLRNSTSSQAQIQTSGKIDADRDGIGEFGTLQELAGLAGVRNANRGGVSDFSERGSPVAPAILAPAMGRIDGEGRVERNGYLYQIFLPDGDSPARWTHETGPAGSTVLSGGSGSVGIDLSETTWCLYAWPVEVGKTGKRVFFVNQSGDVLQSSNEVARHEGTGPFDPSSAFLGQGITSRLAVGTRGNDGDIWKVTN